MGPPRVPIHYFPKKPKPRMDERPTDELLVPLGLSRGPTQELMEAPIARAPTTDPPDEKRGRKRKKRAEPDRRAEAAAEPHQPMDGPGWLAQGAPETQLRGMTRRQIAEMCLFGHHLFEAGRIQ